MKYKNIFLTPGEYILYSKNINIQNIFLDFILTIIKVKSPIPEITKIDQIYENLVHLIKTATEPRIISTSCFINAILILEDSERSQLNCVDESLLNRLMLLISKRDNSQVMKDLNYCSYTLLGKSNQIK
jgi:hypothetical protein